MVGEQTLPGGEWLQPLKILEAMRKVGGHLFDQEAELLLAATSRALTTLESPGDVVEVGSSQGKTTVIFGLVARALNPLVKVYAIDPHDGVLSVDGSIPEVAPTFDTFARNITAAGLAETVVPIQAASSDITWNKPISLLFIDRLHDLQSVSEDFARFAPWVIPGGYIAFHDYGKWDFPGVTQFVDQLVGLGHGQIVMRTGSLVVLQKPVSRESVLATPFALSHWAVDDYWSSQRRSANLAYIVLAHKLPDQTVRLIDRLDAPDVSFCVHIDRNTDDTTYAEFVEGLTGRENVYLLDRVAVQWAKWSMVEATLRGLDRIVQEGLTPDHVVLLSGQDYPLRSAEAIKSFFAKHRGMSFIDYRAMPDDAWGGEEGMAYRFRDQSPPEGLQPFRGSTWWALSGDCAAYVKATADADRDLVRFYESTFFPDEMFFQTVVMRSPFRNRVMCYDEPGKNSREPITVGVNNVHFVDWATGVPKVLGVEDFSRVMESGGLFARKFDITHDAAILDLIDERLGIGPFSAPVIDLSTIEIEQDHANSPGPYDEQFFSSIQAGSIQSARAVVPVVLDQVRPRSVVDLGCGTGEWLAAFRELGIDDVMGIDGDWVPREQLQIPADQFMVHDLCTPLSPDRTFDLALSLEVGEHLPPACAETLAASLARIAPVVLFSAAVPQQGGNNHLNEQWPGYWSDLFQEHGFVTIDSVRPLIWRTPGIQSWYSQNMLIFADASYVERHAGLREQFERHGGPPLPLVHPSRMGSLDTLADELWRIRDAWKAQSSHSGRADGEVRQRRSARPDGPQELRVEPDNRRLRALGGTDRDTLPLVSCICATYNRPPSHQHLIEEAIESFLRQDYPNKELIIVNDAAGQELVCDAPGVRIANVSERFPNLGEKYNYAVDLARGELLAPWDDDDISLSWRLSFSVERLGDKAYFNPRSYWFRDNNGLHFDHAVGYAHNASLVRRDAFEAVGRYAPISVGYDAVIDGALLATFNDAADPNQGSPALTRAEWFYIYRWGVSPGHVSGGGTEENYRRIGERPVEPGRFILSPHWRMEYQAETLQRVDE